MTAAEIRALAANPAASVETRRAAEEALFALERLGTCLRHDAGAATVLVPLEGNNVRRTWRGPP